ncbi:MAG: energy-coupling factor ABC transporter ATP-binding protein [Herminiimonas sp.]|nr:energy-coupling factor ABC transporter ATP-binding protein [Herminiimonas sp.]
MSALLTMGHLRKRFGERVLLDIEGLCIERASAYVLTGANGSGKSTLLRILSGLESAEVDRTCFMGVNCALAPYPHAMRDAVVYVHQHPVMFSGSVASNIGYGLKARGMSAGQIALRVEQAMAWAGVLHLRHSATATLSGGEKQRIALARARVLDPMLLLLDEPTANLDGEAREQVIALIPTLLNEGRSIVMACHDRDLIGLPGVQRLKLRDGQLELRHERNDADT